MNYTRCPRCKKLAYDKTLGRCDACTICDYCWAETIDPHYQSINACGARCAAELRAEAGGEQEYDIAEDRELGAY